MTTGAKRGSRATSQCSPLPFQKNFAQRNAAPLEMLDSPAPCDQVDDGNNQSDHQQEMDETAGHVESPAQKPKDNEDCKNRPKHRYPFKIRNSVSNHQR
jgi:hypothetical protein